MLQFAVKFPASRPSPVGKEVYHFGTCGSTVLFAGSRHIQLNRQLCAGLLSAFSSRGALFLTGCCFKGVDHSFRLALDEGAYHDRSLVACAFNRAADKMVLPAKKVVKEGLPAKAALASRTVWMCGEASLLVLFPSEPIGKGSALALKTMVQANKPVFLVTESEPERSPHYDVYPSGLFGLVSGYWLLPHVYPCRASPAKRKKVSKEAKRTRYFEKVSKEAKRKKQTSKRVTGRVMRQTADPVGVL